MWNVNKQTKQNRLINTDNKLVVAGWQGWGRQVGRWTKYVKGINRHKLPVIK